jgi:hypothetical protein
MDTRDRDNWEKHVNIALVVVYLMFMVILVIQYLAEGKL